VRLTRSVFPLTLRQQATIVSQDTLTNEPVDVASPTTLDGWRAQWDRPSAVVYARAAEHEHDGGSLAACAAAPSPIY